MRSDADLDRAQDSVGGSDLTVRPATPEDADALATLYLDSREAAYPAVRRPALRPPARRRAPLVALPPRRRPG
jgi:hypothetical protein